MITYLPCGCQFDAGTNKFVVTCEACTLTVEKQKTNDAVIKKMTFVERLVALEKKVWG